MIKLATNARHEIIVNDCPTGYYVDSGSIHGKGKVWYLQKPNRSHPQAALFKRRKDVLTAALVFIEGGEKSADQSNLDFWQKRLQLCLETGSTDILNLRGVGK